jgi:hypothetical protein
MRSLHCDRRSGGPFVTAFSAMTPLSTCSQATLNDKTLKGDTSLEQAQRQVRPTCRTTCTVTPIRHGSTRVRPGESTPEIWDPLAWIGFGKYVKVGVAIWTLGDSLRGTRASSAASQSVSLSGV